MVIFILFLALYSLADLSEAIGHCPSGWEYYDEVCYAVGNEILTWTDASEACRARSGKLVEIKSEKTNTFIKMYAINRKVVLCAWLGGTDMFKVGTWVWMSTAELIQSFTDWKPGEPNNIGNNEHCLNLSPTLGPSWKDSPCSYHCYYICEREAVKN